jgi:uncharacterized SAM-binding protein YcdF (DUF218 family)
MFFVFSKLLVIFIYPITWIIVLLLIAVITKQHKLKQRLLICSVALFLFFSNTFFLDLFAHHWDVAPAPLKNSGTYSCVIVLGGFTSENAHTDGFFNGAADRFIEGLKLLTTRRVSHILISSGNGNLLHDNFAEADWVKAQLKQFNVPDSCVLIENHSRNTIENVAYSKLVLNARHMKPPYILVTSAFHMRRSLEIFKNAGIDVVPYPCNYIAGNGAISPNIIPSAEALNTWNIYIKEMIGTLVNHLI